jgi:trans-2,3-dihydro-3-hydroxyanthranilate isomerase
MVLGAAYILIGQAGGPLLGRTRVAAETRAGVFAVDVERVGDVSHVVVTERAPVFGPMLGDISSVTSALHLQPDRLRSTQLGPQVVEAGLPTLVVPVPTRAEIGRPPDLQALAVACRDVGATVVVVFTRETLHQEHTVYVRVFAPVLGVDEDPATGSANAALAAYLVRHGVVEAAPRARISAEQGYAVGRPSLVLAEVTERDGELEVRVGGRVVRAAEGIIYY